MTKRRLRDGSRSKGTPSMDKTPISRGFRSRRQQQTPKIRLPPGQYVTMDFPVLSAGPTPQIKVENWTLDIQSGGSLLGTWSWAAFEALPQTTIKRDIHCVTKWSKLDTTWQGVTFDDLLKAVGLKEPPAFYIMAHCDGGYTTNVPVADLIGGKGMITTRYEGLPIPPAHGGPARLLVPHLYFWKSAKWIRRVRFMEKDQPGFWESFGYHNYGDPWKEQRYDATELSAELDAMARRDPNLRVVNTLTRKQPDGWMGRRGRIDKALLAQECFPPEQSPKIFVCGSTPFVEDVSRFLVELGYDPLTIKTERFGPSGGQGP